MIRLQSVEPLRPSGSRAQSLALACAAQRSAPDAGAVPHSSTPYRRVAVQVILRRTVQGACDGNALGRFAPCVVCCLTSPLIRCLQFCAEVARCAFISAPQRAVLDALPGARGSAATVPETRVDFTAGSVRRHDTARTCLRCVHIKA